MSPLRSPGLATASAGCVVPPRGIRRRPAIFRNSASTSPLTRRPSPPAAPRPPSGPGQVPRVTPSLLLYIVLLSPLLELNSNHHSSPTFTSHLVGMRRGDMLSDVGQEDFDEKSSSIVIISARRSTHEEWLEKYAMQLELDPAL
jgi:hypothetical protein